MSVVSKKFSASLNSMLVLLLLCLVTAFSSGCRMISTALCWSRAFTIIMMP